MRCLPDAPTKYNADPPEHVSRVKKHPHLLQMLVTAVEKQAAQIGGELADVYPPAVEEWNRLMRRAIVPRLSGLNGWVKKAQLEPTVRVSLEGFVKRWKKRADDVVVDWAEMFTDPVVLNEGFAGTDVTTKDVARVVDWMKRQLAKPQKAPVDEEGNPILDSEGQALNADDDDPAGRFDDEDDPILLRLLQLKRGGLVLPNGDELIWEARRRPAPCPARTPRRR